MSHDVNTTQLTSESSHSAISATSFGPVACWRQIGVFGDRSCPQLDQHIHCHNCPVHAAAGLQLLNQGLPQGYRRERTDYFARQHDRRDVSTLSAVLFRVGTEWLALPTRILQEATEYKTIHSLPHRRDASILGLANVRGELMICLSLPHLLGLQPGPAEPPLRSIYERLLIVQSGSSRLGFPVNEVHGPHRFDIQEMKRLSSRPRASALASSQAVLRWQDRVVGLLDLDTLLAICQRSFR